MRKWREREVDRVRRGGKGSSIIRQSQPQVVAREWICPLCIFVRVHRPCHSAIQRFEHKRCNECLELYEGLSSFAYLGAFPRQRSQLDWRGRLCHVDLGMPLRWFRRLWKNEFDSRCIGKCAEKSLLLVRTKIQASPSSACRWVPYFFLLLLLQKEYVCWRCKCVCM